jgi:NitT/TauT family transport system substrate-binding protein
MDMRRAPTKVSLLYGLALLLAGAMAGPAVADNKIAQAPSSPASATPAAPAIKGDGGTIRLVDNPYSTQSYARIVMQKFQLDKKYGFNLQIIPGGNTAASISAIQSGGTDFALFNWLDLARMRSAGVNVTGIGPFLQNGADYFVVPANSPIKNLGDFKGRKIGIYSRTSINWVITVAAAQKLYNFDIQKEAFPQEGAANLLRALLEQGQLDASHIFNNLTPDLMVTGKFRTMVQIKELVDQLGLPSTPFLLWAVDTNYAAAHPGNVKAFLAAYRDAVEILRVDDSAWVEHAKELQMTDKAIVLLREEMRADTWSRFAPENEADIRKTFDLLLAIAGPKVMGVSKLPDGFMTLEYQ